MSLNITLDYSENGQTSAVQPFTFTLNNGDTLPFAFKVRTKAARMFLISPAHGIVCPRARQEVSVRVRPPVRHSLFVVGKQQGPEGYHDEEGSSEDGSQQGLRPRASSVVTPRSSQMIFGPDKDDNGEDSEATTQVKSDLFKVEIMVIVGVLDPAKEVTEGEFKKLWSCGVVHSTHMIPCKVIRFSHSDFYNELQKKQECAMIELDLIRQGLEREVHVLHATSHRVNTQRVEGEANLKVMESNWMNVQSRVTIPWWVGIMAIFVSLYSSLRTA